MHHPLLNLHLGYPRHPPYTDVIFVYVPLCVVEAPASRRMVTMFGDAVLEAEARCSGV